MLCMGFIPEPVPCKWELVKLPSSLDTVSQRERGPLDKVGQTPWCFAVDFLAHQRHRLVVASLWAAVCLTQWPIPHPGRRQLEEARVRVPACGQQG